MTILKRILFYVLLAIVFMPCYGLFAAMFNVFLVDQLIEKNMAYYTFFAVIIITLILLLGGIWIAYRKNKKCARTLILYALLSISAATAYVHIQMTCPAEKPLRIQNDCYSCNHEPIRLYEEELSSKQKAACPNREVAYDDCVPYSVVKGYQFPKKSGDIWDIALDDGPPTPFSYNIRIIMILLNPFVSLFCLLLFLALFKVVRYRLLFIPLACEILSFILCLSLT